MIRHQEIRNHIIFMLEVFRNIVWYSLNYLLVRKYPSRIKKTGELDNILSPPKHT